MKVALTMDDAYDKHEQQIKRFFTGINCMRLEKEEDILLCSAVKEDMASTLQCYKTQKHCRKSARYLLCAMRAIHHDVATMRALHHDTAIWHNHILTTPIEDLTRPLP